MISSISSYKPDVLNEIIKNFPKISSTKTIQFSESIDKKNNNFQKDFLQINDTEKKTKTVSSAEEELTDEEKKVVEKLKQIEREVIAHEKSHLAAGGGLVKGGATYSKQTGPDGRQYIVGGEVKIDASPEPDDPQATITKMQIVRRAALAPADPSAQDRAVAQEASKQEINARMELSRKQMEIYTADYSQSNQYINAFA